MVAWGCEVGGCSVLRPTSSHGSWALVFMLNCCPAFLQISAKTLLLLLLRKEEAFDWPGVKSCFKSHPAAHAYSRESVQCLILSLQDYIPWGERMIRGKLVPEKGKPWSLVLLSCLDLVKYLGGITTLLKNCCVPLFAMQQPLPSHLVCSSSAVCLDMLEVLCDVIGGRNKLYLVLHDLPSHLASLHTAGMAAVPLAASCKSHWFGRQQLLCGEGEMGSVVFSPIVGCYNGDQYADSDSSCWNIVKGWFFSSLFFF